jgi:hypothetical protein
VSAYDFEEKKVEELKAVRQGTLLIYKKPVSKTCLIEKIESF